MRIRRAVGVGLLILVLVACSGAPSRRLATPPSPSPPPPSSSSSPTTPVPAGLPPVLPPTSGVAASPSSAGSPSTASTPASSSPAADAASAGWLTYQADGPRSGQAPGPLMVGSSVRRQWARGDLDGAVYAQPLVVGSTVVVATEADGVYALDAATGATRWHTSLGQAVPASQLPCGNLDPVGITGTPVIDAQRGVVWAVAFVEPGRHDLVALDLASGAVRARRTVDPPGSDPTVQLQRAALARQGSTLFVAFGGRYGDCGRYHGWVVSVDDTGGPMTSWQVPTGREGGIWAPAGPVLDGTGDVWVATGNSASTTTYDDGNSVIRLSSALAPKDRFAPSDWAALDASDTDVGSTSPTIAGAGQIFQIGKSGRGYLLRRDHLGGVGGEAYAAPVCGGAFGATAWRAPTVYVACGDGVAAVVIANGRFSVAWRAQVPDAGPPVLAGPMLWSVSTSSGALEAIDPASGAVRSSVPVGSVPHFPPIAAAGGRLFVPAGRGLVALG